MGFKIKIVKEEESTEQKLVKKNRLLIFVILFLVLGFVVYEFKFADKVKFDKGDNYEEYDSNYVLDDDNDTSAEQKNNSNVVSNKVNNIPSNRTVSNDNTNTKTSNIKSNVASNNTKTSNTKSNVVSNSNKVSNTTSNVTSNTTPVDNTNYFKDDSWETISQNVKSGNTSRYHLGDTKTVSIHINRTDVDATVRIANMSTPSECSTSGFSQTACGFVVEFVDVIALSKMNDGASNKGGWNTSKGRYMLKEMSIKELSIGKILNTFVVSGYGSSDTANFTITDRIYLLSPKEIWGYDDPNDTSSAYTRQLDLYKKNNITNAENTLAAKKYKGEAVSQWLRSARAGENNRYRGVQQKGTSGSGEANLEEGLSPAFRIG